MSGEIDEIIEQLRALASKDPVKIAERRVIPVNQIIGVSTGDVRKLAKRLGADHQLAEMLWKSNYIEAKMLGILTYPAAKMTPKQLNQWVLDINDWSTCDLFVKTLVSKRQDAPSFFQDWCESAGLYRRRAGFALIANYCMQSKQIEDTHCDLILNLIESKAVDGRAHVRQACCWALRELGKIDSGRHEQAIMLALELREKEDKSNQWIGRCAHRELETLIKIPERRRLISARSKTARKHPST